MVNDYLRKNDEYAENLHQESTIYLRSLNFLFNVLIF